MKWSSLEGVVVRRGQQYYRGCGVPSSAVGGGHFCCLTSSPLMSHRLSTESLQFCPNPLFSDFVLYCAAAVRDLPVTFGPLLVPLAMVHYSLGPSGFYIKGQLSRLCFCIVASQQQNEAGLVRINSQISWIRCCGYYLSCSSILCRHYLSVISISLERSCRPFS